MLICVNIAGLSALLVVNYVDVMTVDSLSLAGFQGLTRVCQVGGAGLRLPAHLPHSVKQLNLSAPVTNLYL